MRTFGLVTEGPSDQEVISNLLAGLFDNNDLILNELQPLRDATASEGGQGGWTYVLEYCASGKFREAFQIVDYVIIQIDTDCSEEPSFGVSHRNDDRELTPSELVEQVSQRLIEAIGAEFHEVVSDRTLFAISVHSLECWLLPFYYPDRPAQRKKTVNCLNSLNYALNSKHGFTIDPAHKELPYYRQASRPLADHRVFMRLYAHNASLKLFVEAIQGLKLGLEERE